MSEGSAARAPSAETDHPPTPRCASGDRYRRLLLVAPPMDAIGAEFMMEEIPLRLEYLAAFVRPQLERVEIVDLIKEGKPLRHFLRRWRPDLVGVTLNYISNHRVALELAGEAKAWGADTVFGGYLATALAAEFAADARVDYVVRGEGELTLSEIVAGREPASIRGLSFSHNGRVQHNADRPLIADLDALPFPERDRRKYRYALPFADLEPDAKTAYELIITSRGCWGRCTFCTEPMMSHGEQRYRSAANVIAEIEQLVELHRGKRLRLHIADPNFGGSIAKTHELCDALIAYKQRCPTPINLFVSVRTSTMADHPELVRKLAAAGVDFVFVGMESPKKEVLKAIRKGGGAAAKQERAVRLLREQGAAVMSCFLLGLPGQTEQDVFELLDYARSLQLEDAYFAVVCPLPGSQLYAEAKASGQLLEPDHRKWKLYDLVTPHAHFSPRKMKELCVRCNSKWYDDLMLPQAWRRYRAADGRKRPLYDYAYKLATLLGFFQFFGENQEELSELDLYSLVQELPNDNLRAFTSSHGLDEMFEMRRFLRLLGDQTVQVSLRFAGGREVSWVLAAERGRVRYIDCIQGHAAAADVTIAVPMNGSLPGLGDVLGATLAENKSWRARSLLLRLAAAAAAEASAFGLDRGGERLRSALRRLRNGNGNGHRPHRTAADPTPPRALDTGPSRRPSPA